MATNQTLAMSEQPPKPWYSAYPAQRNTASWIAKETLLAWMEKGKVAGKDFVLVDLRRNDFEVAFTC